MSTSKNIKNTPENKPGMIFSKENYILTLISLLIIIIGFFVMAGKEGDIYDFRRITLAPTIVIIGFVLGIYAIFFKKK